MQVFNLNFNIMKTKTTVYLALFFLIQGLYSQENTKKVLIAKYSLYPYSTEFFDHNTDTPSEKKSFDIALRRTKEFKYTFMSDFKSDKAMFFLDSVITTKIKGKESYWIEPENVIHFAYKNNNRYYKKESIFKRNFYTINTNNFSFEWEITNQTKKIAGFNCTKAISNVRNNKIIAWFTSELPINYSPIGLYGLPGLILQAETFFNTITIDSIKYSDSTDLLNSKINEFEKKYNNEKDDNEIKEAILMLKKAQLIQSLKRMRG